MEPKVIEIALELVLYYGFCSLVYAIRLLISSFSVLTTFDFVMSMHIFLHTWLIFIFLLSLSILFHKEVVLDPISEAVQKDRYNDHDNQQLEHRIVNNPAENKLR